MGGLGVGSGKSTARGKLKEGEGQEGGGGGKPSGRDRESWAKMWEGGIYTVHADGNGRWGGLPGEKVGDLRQEEREQE